MGMERSFLVVAFSAFMSVERPYFGTYLDEKLSSTLKSLNSIGRLAAPLIGLRQLALLMKKNNQSHSSYVSNVKSYKEIFIFKKEKRMIKDQKVLIKDIISGTATYLVILSQIVYGGK